MSQIDNLVKECTKLGLRPILEYDRDRESVYYDMQTGAKSGMYIYPDGFVMMRYSTTNLDPDSDLACLIDDVWSLFRECLCSRDYYNIQWQEFGKNIGKIRVETEIKEKVVFV